MRAETTERPAGSRPEAGVRPVADTISSRVDRAGILRVPLAVPGLAVLMLCQDGPRLVLNWRTSTSRSARHAARGGLVRVGTFGQWM